MRMEMQKLSGELKNIPADASLVRSSINHPLNREETLGVDGRVLTDNIPEENKPSRRGQGLRVPVINLRGEPLIPTTPRRAKMLLKQKKARVLQRKPFVIQLKYPTGESRQDITLGIDSGYANIGFSAVTDKEEMISGEAKLRTDIPKLIEQRRAYRRGRRNKLWYRKPRFDNRKRREGCLAPSVEHKLQSHVRLIEKVKQILPITNIIVEVSSFDTQKMVNPEISGIEYQQGELQGYEVREYLLAKWGRKCVYCNKKDVPLEVEHIIPTSRQGSNRVSNLTISCRKCNLKKGDMTAEEFGFSDIQKQAKESLKSTAFMNVVRKMLAKQVDAEETFGYVTKYGRIVNNLEKSHVNDAFVIANGSTQKRCKPYSVIQTRRNNRGLQTNRRGFNPSIRRQRYKLQPNDLVRYNDGIRRVKGIFNYGDWVRLEDGTDTNVKNVELMSYGKGLQFN